VFEDPVRLRLVTYNVHGCIGSDGRHDVERIAGVLSFEEPDIVALQEVDVGRARTGRVDQPAMIARRLGMRAHFQEAFPGYGIAVLSRLPMQMIRGARLPTWRGPVPVEPRVAMWMSIGPDGGTPLHLVATHLGLIPRERESQAAALLGIDWLTSPACGRPHVLCGDLNSPQRSSTYRRLTTKLRDLPLAFSQGNARPTFPAALPALRIDHVMASDGVQVHSSHTGRSALARRASDHLPLVVDLSAS
jgi:endonuclease/exonuclease/phosphatase family metal-dependent hydrolase